VIDSVGSPGDEVWTQLSASYEAVAHKYEAQFADEMADKPRDRELLSSFAEAVTDPVLEVGCGPGQVGAFVRGCGRAVYGFDFSSQMTKLAAVRLDGAVVGDLHSLPVGSAQLGGLLALYSFIHVRRQGLPDVLREVHRVLRPEGRVLFSVHEGEGVLGRDRFLDEPVPFIATLYMLDELVAVCRDTGLTVSRAERRLPYSSESTVRLR
jgi:SAM-dependent methyltransferase